MLRPVEVKPLSGYRVWIKYDDGECGEIDLSDVAGQGVFKAWDEPGFFEKVHISPTDPSPGTMTWNSAPMRCTWSSPANLGTSFRLMLTLKW